MQLFQLEPMPFGKWSYIYTGKSTSDLNFSQISIVLSFELSSEIITSMFL